MIINNPIFLISCSFLCCSIFYGVISLQMVVLLVRNVPDSMVFDGWNCHVKQSYSQVKLGFWDSHMHWECNFKVIFIISRWLQRGFKRTVSSEIGRQGPWIDRHILPLPLEFIISLRVLGPGSPLPPRWALSLTVFFFSWPGGCRTCLSASTSCSTLFPRVRTAKNGFTPLRSGRNSTRPWVTCARTTASKLLVSWD